MIPLFENRGAETLGTPVKVSGLSYIISIQARTLSNLAVISMIIYLSLSLLFISFIRSSTMPEMLLFVSGLKMYLPWIHFRLFWSHLPLLFHYLFSCPLLQPASSNAASIITFIFFICYLPIHICLPICSFAAFDA